MVGGLTHLGRGRSRCNPPSSCCGLACPARQFPAATPAHHHRHLPFTGLAACRDIKPQNLLVNINTHALKLCDFGSAKALVRGEPNISYICSRYYRAPELIFGATDYTCAIDVRRLAFWGGAGAPGGTGVVACGGVAVRWCRLPRPHTCCIPAHPTPQHPVLSRPIPPSHPARLQVWSVGCVMAELLLGLPLVPGESGVDQLVEIIKVRGRAGAMLWVGMCFRWMGAQGF